MKRIGFARLLWPLLITVGAFTAPASAQENAAEAQRIWEQVIAAKGGREELRKVHSFAVVLTDRDSLDERVVVLPDRVRKFYSHSRGIYRTVEIMNHATRQSWRRTESHSPAQKAWDVRAAEYSRRDMDEWQLAFFLETAHTRPALQRIASRTADRIVIEGRSDRYGAIHYTIDPRTYDVQAVRLEYIFETFGPDGTKKQSTLEVQYEFRDYRDVSGIRMPGRVAYVYGTDKKLLFREASFQVNPIIAPSAFTEAPPEKLEPLTIGGTSVSGISRTQGKLGPLVLAGGGYSSVTGAFGSVSVMFTDDSAIADTKRGFQIAGSVGFLGAEGGIGIATYSTDYVGFELRGFVGRTYQQSGSLNPNETFAGGEVAVNIFGARFGIGFAQPIGSSTPGYGRTRFLWSVSFVWPLLVFGSR